MTKHQLPKSRTRRQFVDVGYGQLHLRVAAPDKTVDNSPHIPLVCLHQSPKSGREFAQFLDIAGTERLTIAPDYPGYGESDFPPAEPSVRIEDYARTMWEALDVLTLGAVDLFGNHTGGAVAVEMAYQQPERVRRIVSISALVLTASERAEFDQLFQAVPLDEQGSRFKQIWNGVNMHRSAGLSYELMAMSFAESLRGGEAYEWGHHAAFAYSDLYIERIASLAHRIIVLNPADMLNSITSRVTSLLRNGKVIDLPNWQGEILNIHPHEVYQILSESLSGH